jgi:hypothetical protein
MITRRRHWAVAIVTLTIGITGTLVVQRVRAAGAPTTNALTYTGYLALLDGTAVNGSKNLALLAYDGATAGNLVCQVLSTPVVVTAGRFQLALPDVCATAVKAKADLWIDVQVDGASIGRTKLGAVPYALEASHAVSADSATAATGTLATSVGDLTTRLTALEATNVHTMDSKFIQRTDVAANGDTGTHWDSCVGNLSATSCSVVANRTCAATSYRGGFWTGECQTAACTARQIWCFK